MHRAVMIVVAGRAIGELRHLQRAEPDGAGIFQPLQRRRGRARDEVAADQRAAGHDMAGVVIHVLVRQRHAMQRAAVLALGERCVGLAGCLQRLFGFDRHEGIELRLPLRDAMQAGARHFVRGELLAGDRLRDGGQAHQGGLGAHFTTCAVCIRRWDAGSRSNGSVPAIAAKPSKAGPIELDTRSATSALIGTPATSAIAMICFRLGLLMLVVPAVLPARGCDRSPEWPSSTPPDAPLYRARSALALLLRRAAPRTDNGCGTGSPRADRSDWADRPKSAASACGGRGPTTASPRATPAYRDAPAPPTPAPPAQVRRLRRDTSPARDRRCSARR